MADPQTIRDVVKQLQEAVAQVLPEMQVTVSINLTPAAEAVKEVEKEAVKQPKKQAKKKKAEDKKAETKKEDAKDDEPVTLDNLRTLLNSYAKAAGKDKALDLVSRYSSGTKNPADIPEDQYKDVIAEMGGVELDLKGDE